MSPATVRHLHEALGGLGLASVVVLGPVALVVILKGFYALLAILDSVISGRRDA